MQVSFNTSDPFHKISKSFPLTFGLVTFRLLESLPSPLHLPIPAALVGPSAPVPKQGLAPNLINHGINTLVFALLFVLRGFVF
jgi:hypothetical protein